MMESEPKARLTLGEFLKQVRETHGLSIEYVAEQLKLKISTVRDLEANYYDHVGRLVYIKGYLRSYARLLNLDIEDQLQLNNNSDAEIINVPVNDEDAHKEKRVISHKWFTLFGFLIILIVLLVMGVHFYTVKNKSHSIKNSSIAATQQVAPSANVLSHPSLNIVQAPEEKKPTPAAVAAEPPADSEPAVE